MPLPAIAADIAALAVLTRIISAEAEPGLVAALLPDGYRAQAERAYLIDVVGFDWNCPQHITPRFTEAELADQLQPMLNELTELRSEVERLRNAAATAPLKDRP